MAEEEDSKASNFRRLYQETADFMYPCENQITSQRTPGQDKSIIIRDPTAMFAADDMVSGLIGTWIPGGQNFFNLRTKNRVENTSSTALMWLAYAAEILHEEMFGSNFMLQLHDTIKALVVFGTGCLFTEWDYDRLGLNYKDRHISTYTIKQNAMGIVDTVIFTYELSARQATTEFDNPGEKALQSASTIKDESKKYKFIEVIRPRLKRNQLLVDKLNMPIENIVVNVEEKKVVYEGGFEEMPAAVPRWEKSSVEKYGRGRGTVILSVVKELQQMWLGLMNCGERWNNPPRWQLEDAIEGVLDNRPGALNIFTQPNAAGALEGTLNGNYPISKEIIEVVHEVVNKAFAKDIFVQMGDLKGDRRTTVEISARLKEGLRRLVSPIARLEYELFTPTIIRSFMILIRNGIIPPAPQELVGQRLSVEYVGELAMAMRTYQSRAFTEYVSMLMAMSEKFPEATDILNLDRALPRVALSSGVNSQDLNTEEEIMAKRQARQQQQEQMQQLMAQQAQAEAYKNTQKAPEQGSPAAEMAGV